MAADGLAGDFARGFVATGLLAASRERGEPMQRMLRGLPPALRGGVALAAGGAAARSLARGDLVSLAIAVAGGAAILTVLEPLLGEVARQTPPGDDT